MQWWRLRDVDWARLVHEAEQPAGADVTAEDATCLKAKHGV